MSKTSVELRDISNLEDEAINVAQTALLLASLDRPGLSLSRYEIHLEKITQDVADHFETLCKKNEKEKRDHQASISLLTAKALQTVIHDARGYEMDSETPDDIQNLDMTCLIDRRKGGSIILSILYLHIGKALGWDVSILGFADRALILLVMGRDRLILDPCQKGKIMQAADLRQLVKKRLGEQEELSAEYYLPLSNRDILIGLRNSLKYTQIDMEDYEGALKNVELMRVVDPEEYRLLMDAGVLYARIGKVDKAIEALELYMDRTPNVQDRHDAALILQQIRNDMKEL